LKVKKLMSDVEHTATLFFVQPCPTVPVIRRWRFMAASAANFSCIGTSPVYGFLTDRCGNGVARKDMPKSAATMFGLVLVASSIGFNIWRYPIVSEMAGPIAAPAVPTEAPATEPGSSHSSGVPPRTQPAETPSPEPQPATPPPALATQGEAKAADGAAGKAADGGTPQAAERGRSAPNDLERPLVAIPRIATTARSDDATEAGGAVHRLPPVDPNMPPIAGSYASGSSGGAIPIYPSTGIE
jgi:hypothetical protein